MKKTLVVINWIVFVFIVLIAIGMGYAWNLAADVESFLLEEYDFYLTEIPQRSNYDEVPSADTAKAIAEEIWIAEFGVECANYKPYSVFFDQLNTAWLVRGNLDYFARCFGIYRRLGGEPYIIINQEDGQILAVWHTK